MLVFAVLMAALQGAMPATLSEPFPTRVLMSAVSLGYNVGQALFGGTAPLVCTYLIKVSGSPMDPAGYLFLVAAVSTVAFLTFPETRHADLGKAC